MPVGKYVSAFRCGFLPSYSEILGVSEDDDARCSETLILVNVVLATRRHIVEDLCLHMVRIL